MHVNVYYVAIELIKLRELPFFSLQDTVNWLFYGKKCLLHEQICGDEG